MFSIPDSRSVPLCHSSLSFLLSSSTLPHTRSNQHSTRIPPRKRNNSKVLPDKLSNNPCPSSVWVAGPVDTVLAEGRSTFVAVVVERHIVVDRSLGRLGGRSFVVGTEDRLGSSLGSTCLLNRFSRMCGLRVAFGLMLCVRDPFVRR
jgi:hypothetical protein